MDKDLISVMAEFSSSGRYKTWTEVCVATLVIPLVGKDYLCIKFTWTHPYLYNNIDTCTCTWITWPLLIPCDITWPPHEYHICITFVSHDLTQSHMTSHSSSAWTPYQWGRISHRTPPQAQWALSWWRHSMIWYRHGGHCYWWLLPTRSTELMLYSFLHYIYPHVYGVASSPGPAQKLGKGPGVTCKDSHMRCVSSLCLE